MDKENNNDEKNLLEEIEDAVYSKLSSVGFMIKDMPLLVAYLMAFCVKLHIGMGGSKARLLKLCDDVWDNLYEKREEIVEDFKEFIDNNTISENNEQKDKKEILN